MAGGNAAAHSAAANENNTLDQDSLPLEVLAAAVLDRSIRPRAASVRRLAEAVLTSSKTADTLKKKKAKKNGKANSSTKKKVRPKKRKLAKIPGQKGQ